MKICLNCNLEINDDYNFCPHCAEQIKCLKCGKDLGRGFSVCPYCGIKLLSQDNKQVLNEYSFLEEKVGDKYKRSVNLKATNDAVEKLGELIISNSQPILGVLPLTNGNSTGVSIPQEESLQLPPSSEKKEETSIQVPMEAHDPYEMVKDYIFPLDGKLEVKLVNFRGNSNADNQRRFILFFVGGYQYHFPNQVPTRSQVIERAKSLGLWSTTFSNLITNLGKELLIESKDGLRLSPTAKQEVVKIIKEIINPSDSTSTNSNTKQGRKNTRSKPKSGTEKEQKINEWINALGIIRNYDVRNLQKSLHRQKLQFGLWVLKKTARLDRVPFPLLIDFVIKAFPTIGATKDSLRKSATGDKFFGRTDAGEYFLTKEGQLDIEQLLPEEIKV